MIESIDKFIHDQMSVWPELAAAHRALKSVQTRQEEVGGLKVTLQHNPSRIASSVVDVKKKKDICLLCAENRPREQRSLPIEGRKGRKYEILLNRYPVFPNHLVIVRDVHTPQTIWHRYVDMLDMAAALQDYVILYNGPVSGASIPEHMHFQACPKGYMPLERAIDRCLGDVEANLGKNIEYIASVQDARLYHYLHFARGIFCLKAATAKSMAKLFYRLLDCAPIAPGESEPRFNAVTYFAEGEYRAIVMCRTAHRSHHYFSSGVGELLIFFQQRTVSIT